MNQFISTTIIMQTIFQGSASTLLASMEREKELLRIFLKVSQMENTILRRMNLSSFLMVSVSVGGCMTTICATKSRKLQGWCWYAAAVAISGVASSWFGQALLSRQPPLGTALRCLSCPICPPCPLPP